MQPHITWEQVIETLVVLGCMFLSVPVHYAWLRYRRRAPRYIGQFWGEEKLIAWACLFLCILAGVGAVVFACLFFTAYDRKLAQQEPAVSHYFTGWRGAMGLAMNMFLDYEIIWPFAKTARGFLIVPFYATPVIQVITMVSITAKPDPFGLISLDAFLTLYYIYFILTLIVLNRRAEPITISLEQPNAGELYKMKPTIVVTGIACVLSALLILAWVLQLVWELHPPGHFGGQYFVYLFFTVFIYTGASSPTGTRAFTPDFGDWDARTQDTRLFNREIQLSHVPTSEGSTSSLTRTSRKEEASSGGSLRTGWI